MNALAAAHPAFEAIAARYQGGLVLAASNSNGYSAAASGDAAAAAAAPPPQQQVLGAALSRLAHAAQSVEQQAQLLLAIGRAALQPQ